MSFLRLIGTDLVEKRLWPVAVALGLGTIAAPAVVSMAAHRNSAERNTRSAPPSATGKPVSAGLRGLLAQSAGGEAGAGAAAGHLHDPFAGSSGGSATANAPGAPGRAPGGQTSSPSSTVSAPGAASTSAGSKAVGPASTASGTGSAAGTAHPTHATPRRGAPVGGVHHPSPVSSRLGARGVYRVLLHFGPAARPQTLRAPRRLTALPSTRDPQVVFLGVLRGGRRASFLLSSTATASGDGVCHRGTPHCQVIDLAPGDSEFLDVRSPTAGLIQYELDLDSIWAHRAPNAARARRERRSQAPRGPTLVHELVGPRLPGVSFSPKLGVLVSVKAPAVHQPARAQAASASPLPASSAAPATPAGRPPVPASGNSNRN